MSRFPRLRSLLSVLLFVLLAVTPASADEFKDAKKQYNAYLKRPSLFMRTRGRKILARTKDPRALEVFAKSYKSAEEPRDQVRYLIVTISANNLNTKQMVPIWDAWREKHTKERDAWLWFRGLGVHLERLGAAELGKIALSKHPAVLRAAAIEALIWKEDDGLLDLVAALGVELPEEGVERAILIESAAHALFVHRDKLGDEPFNAAAAWLIDELDNECTLPRTQLVIARRLARIFDTDILGLNAEPWRLELLRGTADQSTGDPRYGGRPTFIGIKASGNRIVYVIDLSDSMLTPLTGKEKADLKGPVTGHDTPKSTPKEQLPWDKITNRFEAAREFLKMSLRGLKEDQHFAVIFFGTEAARLKSSPGLMAATPARVSRVIKELDAIKAGAPNRRRPNGILEGNTNIHGGMHRAFKLHGKSMVKADEYVDPRTFLEGCDTIFLLSDGAPTMDDWPDLDKRDPQDRGGDPEMGRGGAQPDQLNYFGPYAQPPHLVDDIRRLNLFRKVEIHCIGMGEARMPLLRRIANLGMGKARKIGEPEPEEDEDDKDEDEDEKKDP